MFQPNKKFKTEPSDCAPPNIVTAPEKTPKAKPSRETIINVGADNKLLQPKRNNARWCKIYFGEFNECDGFNFGKIILTLEKPLNNLDFNNVNIAQRFPGLITLRIQGESFSADSRNVVEFQTRQEISEADATRILSSAKSIKPDNKYIKLTHFTYSFKKLNMPADLIGKFAKFDSRKIFKIEFERYNSMYREITLQIKVYASAIKGDPTYVEEMAPNMTGAIPILDYYFLSNMGNTNNSADEYRPGDDAQRFFSMMQEYHSEEYRPYNPDRVQDYRLIPQLLDYQKDAVAWMLSREGVSEFCDAESNCYSTEHLQQMLSLNINKRVNLKAFGNKCVRDAYYSRATGCLSWEKQPIEKLPSTGGILADEMGLGKTIELISLILLNPRTNMADANKGTVVVNNVVKVGCFECTCGMLDSNAVNCFDCGSSQHPHCVGFDETSRVQVPSKYLCPHCIAKSPPKPSKSTLIVVPNSLLKQWEEEIENNVEGDALRIYIYSGFTTAKKYVHPDVLSQHDIVLTSYEILRQEIHYTDLAEVARLRDYKRYAAMPCPPTLIEWWRVCLDEAQMVENVNWKFAKFACMIPAVNRWCVTGTPIPKSLQDLYGIVCFLDIDPITDIRLWESVIMEPFKLKNGQMAITTNLFGKIFWRTEKIYVQVEMRLPRQTELIHRLEFSPAERYFYDQRALYWIDKFKAAVGNIERKQEISTLNNSQLLPFRRLRHICTHPQLDEEAFKAVDIFIERDAKLTYTVFELVDWLIKRAVMRCQKAYKTQMVALNDVAGLHLMRNELELAARQYRCAINLADDNKDVLKTEDANLLHALINLNYVHRNLNLQPFDTRINGLIENFVQKKAKEIVIASNVISHNHYKVNIDVDEMAWWIRAINYIKNDANATELLQTLVTMLKQAIPVECMTLKQPDPQSLCCSAFIANLQDTLQKNLVEICTKRNEIFDNWQAVSTMNSIPTYLKLSLLECGHFEEPTTPNDGSTNLPSSCRLCCFDSNVMSYESLLSRPPLQSDYTLEDIRMKSWTESILNVIYRFAQKYRLPVTILGDAKHHIGTFCDLKNEVLGYGQWSNKISERATAIQKLLDDSKPTFVQSLPISSRTQVGSEAIERSDQEFIRCQRDLMYLKGLKRYAYSTNDSIIEFNPEECDVYHPTQKWGFLPCNHFFCANCCFENQNAEISCKICSKKSVTRTSTFIDMASTSRHKISKPSLQITDEPIWRMPFAKVGAVVRTLLSIKRSHPNDKALVICSCDGMLQVLEFMQNSISYILYKSESHKSKRGSWVRYRTDSTQVLLMPFSVDSTSLNLTEANHVLLVDPYLNLAIEQQAIGRIHRLGQRKETFVHKFYVAHTVEEKLVRMNENKKMSSFVDGNMTIQDLLDLFEKSVQTLPQAARFDV